MELRIPRQIPQYAKECLDAIVAAGYGRYLSLGGAFGLAHYFEYRSTNDVDAWWKESAGREIRDRIIDTLVIALEPFGKVKTRRWGDVTSVELEVGGARVFSFQIAGRSAQLEEPRAGLWEGGITVDSFEDLIASKMTALVERGAPRDFRDIYMVCSAGLCTMDHCWELWNIRQRLARENTDGDRARRAIRTHLSRIQVARPLNRITDPVMREQATRLRSWYEKEFLA